MAQSYLSWKWNILSKRRRYYFYLLNLFLLFIWLSILYEVNSHTVLSRKSLNPFHFIPFLFFLFHCCYLGAYFLPEWVQVNLYEKSKMLYVNITSWIFSSVVLIFLKKRNELSRTHDNSNIIFLFTSTVLVGLIMFHHLGIPAPLLDAIKGIFAVLWLVFLAFTVRVFLFSI
jgi:hypothetical protein